MIKIIGLLFNLCIANAIYISEIYTPPKTHSIKDFIKDENMLEYLDNVFSSVQFPTYNVNIHENKNRHNHTTCHCDGCYIENECLEFLRQHICEKIKGTFCDS